jgi:hypothetical protein
MSIRFPRRSLRVEPLEDRTVPADFSAATVPELIAAIDASNLTAETDSITLVAGSTFTLTAVHNTADGPTGLPVIAPGEDLTVVGNGCVIERSAAAGTPAFRLLDVSARGALALTDVTLQGGLAFGYSSAACGGAIYSQGALTLSGVTVQNNRAVGGNGFDAVYYPNPRGGDTWDLPTPGGTACGGGVYVGGGSAVLAGVTLFSNTAQGGIGGDGLTIPGGYDGREKYHKYNIPSADGGAGLGGGLYVAGGTATVSDSTLTYNNALGGAAGSGRGGSAGVGIGGGIYIAPFAAVTLDDFTLSLFKRNKASTSDPNVYGPYTVGP